MSILNITVYIYMSKYTALLKVKNVPHSVVSMQIVMHTE